MKETSFVPSQAPHLWGGGAILLLAFLPLALLLPTYAQKPGQKVPRPTPTPTTHQRTLKAKEAPPASKPSPTPTPTPTPKPEKAVIPLAGSYQSATLLCTLEGAIINESSGVAASRKNPGVFFTHNDSGDGAYLYAFDRKGKTSGVFIVRSASALDWEDIACGPGPKGKGQFVYLGDMGDFYRNRTDCCLYRFPEPTIKAAGRIGTKTNPLLTDDPTTRLQFQYPDGPHDAETLLVHPQTGELYIVTKEKDGAAATIYKFPEETGNWFERYTLIKVGSILFPDEPHRAPRQVTGGDIAPDGRRLVLRTYYAAYEWRLPDEEKDFDAIWQTTPVMIPLPETAQGEGICYTVDGKALITTTEKRPTPIHELKAK